MRRKYRLVSETEEEKLPVDEFAVDVEQDDDEGGESGSGSGGIRIREGRRDFSSYETTPLLVDEKEFMEAERRLLEQAHNRKIAGVEVRHHPEKMDNDGPGAQMKQHPLLENTQQLDGIGENLAANPLNSEEAKRELENQLRHQHQKKMEKQQSLSQAPTLKAG